MFGNMAFGFALASLIPQKMGLHNPYVNGIMIGLSNIVAHIFMLLTFHIFSRKCYHYLHISGILTFSTVVLVLSLTYRPHNFTVDIFESILSGC